MKNILCLLNLHKYRQESVFYNRCDNCENISSSCFPTGIKVMKCEKCGMIKIKDNYCKVCGYKYTC